MSYAINETHDPSLQSWVESANDPAADFPIQNLPFGAFLSDDDEALPSVCVAIGDSVLDLSLAADVLWDEDEFDELQDAISFDSLLLTMLLDPEQLSALRRRLSRALRTDCPRQERERLKACLFPMDRVELLLPASIGDYTDFYASIHHATNIGRMFRPEQPLLPNYKWVPIGYHGRASSIVLSGTPIHRPSGQTLPEGAAAPVFGPSRALDYELEVGCFVCGGNPQGEAIGMEDAEEQMFGLVLVNDWSARDIQRWEYQPLGPFLSKSFATTISPWIVTMEALAPFRAPAVPRPEGDPEPLPHLDSPANRAHGGFDIQLEVLLSTDRMRANSLPPQRLSASNTRDLYWTFAQMLAHHTSNGCNLQPGDLLASGTVSGPVPGSEGSLIELTNRGAQPLALPSGETRRFLEDGDEVIFQAHCERDGFRRIGFGENRARIAQ